MSHGTSTAGPIDLDREDATAIADAFTVLASPGRVLILGRLCRSPEAVGELALAAGLTPSATSHQLRVLRNLGWVVRHRSGRQVIYSLHDDHVSDLLAQALFHLDHVRTGHHAAAPQVGRVDADRSPAPA